MHTLTQRHVSIAVNSSLCVLGVDLFLFFSLATLAVLALCMCFVIILPIENPDFTQKVAHCHVIYNNHFGQLQRNHATNASGERTRAERYPR